MMCGMASLAAGPSFPAVVAAWISRKLSVEDICRMISGNTRLATGVVAF